VSVPDLDLDALAVAATVVVVGANGTRNAAFHHVFRAPRSPLRRRNQTGSNPDRRLARAAELALLPDASRRRHSQTQDQTRRRSLPASVSYSR